MTDLKIATVPRDLYYHEVAYVRGLETKRDELVAICERIRDGIIGDGITPADLDALYAAIAKAKEQP